MQKSAEGNGGRMDWAMYMRSSWKSPWRCPQVAAAGFRGHEVRVVGVVGDGGDAIFILLDGYDTMGIGYMALWGFRAKSRTG